MNIRLLLAQAKLQKYGIDGFSPDNKENEYSLTSKWSSANQKKFKDQIELVNEEQIKLIQKFMFEDATNVKEKKHDNLDKSSSCSEWFLNFKKEHLDPMALKFEGMQNVFDPNIRRLFLIHAQAILVHYGKEKSGSVFNLINAVKLVNEELDEYYHSMAGYVGLVRVLPELIKILANKEVNIKGKLGDAIALARKDNTPRNNRIPLIQVTCQAEQDFVSLVIFYLKQLLLAEKRPIFDSNSFRMAVAIMSPVANKIITLYEGLIKEYQSQQVNANKENSAPLMPEQSAKPEPDQQIKDKIQHDNEQKTELKQNPTVGASKLKSFPSQNATIKPLSWMKPELTTPAPKNEFYYQMFEEFSKSKKMLGSPKIQRALFCAAAAILSHSKYSPVCQSYLTLCAQSKNITHRNLALGLLETVKLATLTVEKPLLNYLAKSNNKHIKESWAKAVLHKDFINLLIQESGLEKENTPAALSIQPRL